MTHTYPARCCTFAGSDRGQVADEATPLGTSAKKYR